MIIDTTLYCSSAPIHTSTCMCNYNAYKMTLRKLTSQGRMEPCLGELYKKPEMIQGAFLDFYSPRVSHMILLPLIQIPVENSVEKYKKMLLQTSGNVYKAKYGEAYTLGSLSLDGGPR